MIPASRSTAKADLDTVRARRTALSDELHGVQYWRRVAKAHTDLLVASLLYGGHADLDDLPTAPAPDGADPGAAGQRPGAGEQLERLREREHRMVARERVLRDELDTVTHDLVTLLMPRQGGRRATTGTLETS